MLNFQRVCLRFPSENLEDEERMEFREDGGRCGSLEPEICQVVLTSDALRMAPQPKQMPGGDTLLDKNSCRITDLTRTIHLWIESRG